MKIVCPRRFSSGAALGVAGALLVAALELGWIAKSALGYFDGPAELTGFILFTAGVLAGAGLFAGVLEGAVAWALDRAWRARVPTAALTALATPAIAIVSAQIFRGPKARTIPGHTLWSIAIGLALAGGLHVGIALWRRLYTEGDRRTLRAVGGAALVATVLAYVADQLVLPRLYPFFHVGLSVCAFVSAQLAVAAWWRARGRPLGGRIAVGLALAAAVAGAVGLVGLDRSRGLRTLALERTAPLARLLRLAPHRRQASATVVAAPALPRPVPVGPRLGAADVFLITVDAMRADRLTPEIAPAMSALASSGVNFTRAYTQVPHTSFSVATLLTGKHVYALSALGLDAAAHETLAQVMRRERYKTAAFYPPSVFFIDHERLKGLEQSSYGFEYVKYEYLPADQRTTQVIDFFAAERPERAFVWVHYLEPHEPYEPHGALTRSQDTIGRYDGEVRFVDAQVARLVDWIRAHRPRALVIIAADHGEEFGEHGGHYHGTTLYEEQVRVPLVFSLLGSGPLEPARIDAPVGLVDVAPTVLALLGIAPSLRMRGQDLSPLFSLETRAGVTELSPQFAEIDRQKMIVEGPEKLICDLETDDCRLYDLARDPRELKPIVYGARVGRLRARLDEWMTAGSRFEAERSSAASGTGRSARRALDRARLGDRTSARELAELLRDPDPGLRLEAVRLLAALPADPSTRGALEEAARDPALAHAAELALARLGDPGASARVAGWIGAACDRDEPAWCARAALALGDPTWLGRALARASEPDPPGAGDGAPQGAMDERLTVAVVRALGASHDPRALEPLASALGPVRTRAEVVGALGELGDLRALPTLLRWLPADPYINVRAAIARALARLAPRDPAVHAALVAQAAREPEPLVQRALAEALGTPSRGATPGTARARPRSGPRSPRAPRTRGARAPARAARRSAPDWS
jgi:arylsulfatase A-like enzyme/HEAT repeat protein